MRFQSLKRRWLRAGAAAAWLRRLRCEDALGRLLLVVSGWQLLLGILVLFLLHLRREPGRVQLWLDAARITIQADVIHVSCALLSSFCLLAAAFQVLPVSLSRLGREGRVCLVLAGLLLATLCWSSLVRISELYGLELVPTSSLLRSARASPSSARRGRNTQLRRDKGSTQKPPRKKADLESGLRRLGHITMQRRLGPDDVTSFAATWLQVPVGLFQISKRTILKPGILVCRVVPRLSAKAPRILELGCASWRWWEWRELLVGASFWISCCALALKFLRRLYDREQLRSLCMPAVWYILATYAAFVVSAKPWLQLLAFLVQGADRLLNTILGRGAVALRWEEVLALAALLWLLLRALYIDVYTRNRRRRAQQELEAKLLALLAAPPFLAELDAVFGEGSRDQDQVHVEELSSGDAGISPDTWRDVEKADPCDLGRLRQALLQLRGMELRADVPGKVLLPHSLQFSVRRPRLLQESLHILYVHPVAELLAPTMSVCFEGEFGVDAGGLYRDWFDSVARSLAACDTGPCGGPGPLAGDRDSGCLTLRPMARRVLTEGEARRELNSEELEALRWFIATGRFLALSVLRGRPLPLQLSRVCCKNLLLCPLDMSDVARSDPEFFRHRVQPLLQPGGLRDLEQALGQPLTFLAAAREGGHRETKALFPGGDAVQVQESNLVGYLRLLCEDWLCGAARLELQCLQEGFWDILPLHILKSQEVTPEQLSALISGSCNPDPEEWRLHSSLCGKANTPRSAQVIEWFWEAVEEDLTAEQRCLLLRFTTGSSRPPIGGFADLQPSFALEVSSLGSEQHLPTAHTCANKLVLHLYSSKAQLLEKLMAALCDEGFGTI